MVKMIANQDDARAKMRDLFQDWLGRQTEGVRKRSLGTLKGQVASQKAARARTMAWASEMLMVVQQAREDLGVAVGPEALAKWLNEHHHKTSTGNWFRGSNLGTTLFSVDKLIAADAVMECRTKMSALALSANFDIAPTDSQPLEAECIERIKEGIVLARQLERRSILSENGLTVEAQQMAKDEANRQRDDGRYAPMLARECYLTMAEFDEAVPDIERMLLMK
jgi:hypothetical protein